MNDKTLRLYRLSKPELLGYPDIFVLSDPTGELIRGACGTNPNPKRMSDDKPWNECFAQCACGTYVFKCWVSQKHGKCLKVNDGGKVPTTNIDPNTWTKFATAVECHKGDTLFNRGSVACFTWYPPLWDTFISYFAMDETGILILQEGQPPV